MALTRLPGFTLDSTSSFTFANANVTANVTAGNVKTDNLLYANGSPWALGGTYANSNVAAYLPTYTGNINGNIVTLTGNITSINATLGNLVTANFYSGNGSLLTSLPGANVTGTVANATFAVTAGTVTTNAQPNITSLGTLASLTVTGLTTATGGVKTANILDTSGTITLQTKYNSASGDIGVVGNIVAGTGGTGNVTATYFIGNGSQLTGLPATYSNTNVASYLPTYTGNVSASFFIGDGSQLTGLPASYSNVNVAAYLPTYTGNISAGNIITSGSSGNISGANYVIANYFSGDGSLLDNIVAANIDGTVATATTAATVTTAAQPNITSVGTLSSVSVTGTATAGNLSTAGTLSAGDATITGNLVVNGTTVTANVSTLNVKDPIIEMGGNTSGGALTSNDGKDRGTLLHYYSSAPIDAFMGWDNSNGEFAFGSNVSMSSEVATFNTFGNVRAGYFLGNGSQLTGTIANANHALIADAANAVAGANVTGQVANALVAGTVYTNAQPNITSVGTLSSLSVTANITGGNINGGNAVVANYFIGDGSLLTGLPASYANANVANYLPTYTGNFSPSNLVVSTSANLGAVGNVIITGGSANYVLTTDGAGALSWAAQSGGGSSTSTTISVDNFTGNGVADTYTLSVTPTSVNSVFVNYNGAFVGRGSYSLSGANLTFGSVPANGASIEVTTIEGLTIGSGAFTTRTATGDGSTTDYTVTSGATASSVLATLDGVLQTPTTDYTISGTTLTFTLAPYNGAAIQLRELAVASSSGGGGGASNTSIRAQAMTMGIIFGG